MGTRSTGSDEDRLCGNPDGCHPRGRFAAISFAVLTAGLAATGCSTTTVSVPAPDPVTEYRERNTTSHTYFWGLLQDPQTVVAGNCESNALDSVRVSGNFGFALVTVLSLGIWSPIEVNWRCAEAGDGGSGQF